jgi:hypothetical protein
VRRFPSNRRPIGMMLGGVCLLSIAFFDSGCADDSTAKQREFLKLEAAVGMVAGAGPEERAIRLEQLENIPVRFEETVKLKALCVSSYQAFEKAARLLDAAKRSTAEAEAQVAEAEQKKLRQGALLPAEEQRIVALGKKAASSLEEVTEKLNSAERLISSCLKEKSQIRFEMVGQ